MFVITGATGALNGATVDHLLDRVSAAEVAVVTRDVAKAQRFADRGVEVRHGDYAQPATLPHAFEGATQLLLVSSNDAGADAAVLHGAAIAAAAAAGAGRILYTSHQNATPGTAFKPGRDHAATERMLAESGVAWTSLRNGFYLHSLDWMAGPWRETGVISVPGDGPVSWTAREDAAEAAAAVLLTNGAYDGPITLTAAAGPTFEEVAAIASEASGRTVKVEIVAEEAWLSAQIARGVPEGQARFLLGFYQAARHGDFAGVDPLLGELLGRAPRTVRDLITAPAA